MRVLCVDDEVLMLQKLVSCVREAIPDVNIMSTQKSTEALAWAEDYHFDIAFLDINMRHMTGLELAAMIKRFQPRINLVFVTAHSEYKADAMDLRASGYIMKPVTRQKILEELAVLRYQHVARDQQVAREQVETRSGLEEVRQETLISAQCFGIFDVFDKKGNHINFSRSKAKEMLAYLIYRQGARCTMREIATNLFENQFYDARIKDSCRHIMKALTEGLKEIGAQEVVIKMNREYAVNRSLIDCDFYRFLAGQQEVRNTYNGQFMLQYSWADDENGHLNRVLDSYSGW